MKGLPDGSVVLDAEEANEQFLLWVMNNPRISHETRQAAWRELCLRMARD